MFKLNKLIDINLLYLWKSIYHCVWNWEFLLSYNTIKYITWLGIKSMSFQEYGTDIYLCILNMQTKFAKLLRPSRQFQGSPCSDTLWSERHLFARAIWQNTIAQPIIPWKIISKKKYCSIFWQKIITVIETGSQFVLVLSFFLF